MSRSLDGGLLHASLVAIAGCFERPCRASTHRERVRSAALGWVVLSACQAGVLMTLAPPRGSARYGAVCAALGGLTGLAALAASGWGAYAFDRGDTDAMWAPLAVAPVFLTTSPMLLLAGMHAYIAGRRGTS